MFENVQLYEYRESRVQCTYRHKYTREKKNVELEQSYAKSVMNRQSPFTGIEITVKKQSVCKKNKNQNISTEKENIMANSVLAGVFMYVCACIYTI